MSRLYPSFRKYIADQKLLREGDSVIASVSGGIDSMVMFDLLTRLAGPMRLSLAVVHVNHRLRDREADGDEALVSEVSSQRGLPFYSKILKPHPGENVQDAARQLRQAYLAEIAGTCGARAICLGHHRGDQAETIMMHLLRGAGLSGLRGMRGRVMLADGLRLVRPLLFASRADIEAYARERAISYRDDSSNAKGLYRRNEIRQRLMPLLCELNPRAEEILAAMGARLSEDEDTLAAIAVASFEEALIDRDKTNVSIRRMDYDALPIAIRRRVLREMFAALAGSMADLNSDQLKTMDGIALSEKASGEYRLKAPWRFKRVGDVLLIERALPRPHSVCRKPR
jgi:tRNA(Ile)-lysidine synthase